MRRPLSTARLASLAAIAAVLALAVAAGPARSRAKERGGNELLGQVLSLVGNRYVDTLGDSALFAEAARGVVRQLGDPYSELYSPKELERFETVTEGHYAGVGMLVEDQEGTAVVARVYPNTPAARAGVAAGDRIGTVNGIRVHGWPLDRVTDSLRGRAGTQVRVGFVRAGTDAPVDTRLAREVVRIPAVPYATLLPGNVGYVPLQQFSETAASETRHAVDSLIVAGATSLVLDVRGNGGGIVDQAVDIGSIFLPPKSLMLRVRARGGEAERYQTERVPSAPQLPLVLLVDDGTASASEILAGALQDHDRALLLGERTFGKGLMQGVWHLDGGWALKLTTGRWMTPNGRSIHRSRSRADSTSGARTDSTSVFASDAGRALRAGGGIAPDVAVRSDTLGASDAALAAALAARREAAYHALSDYAIELRDQVRRAHDTALTVTPEWREGLWRRWQAAGVLTKRPVFDAARGAVDRMLVANVGRLAWGDAQVERRLWSSDAPLARAVDLLRQARTTPELLALGAAQPQPPTKTATGVEGKPQG